MEKKKNRQLRVQFSVVYQIKMIIYPGSLQSKLSAGMELPGSYDFQWIIMASALLVLLNIAERGKTKTAANWEYSKQPLLFFLQCTRIVNEVCCYDQTLYTANTSTEISIVRFKIYEYTQIPMWYGSSRIK